MRDLDRREAAAVQRDALGHQAAQHVDHRRRRTTARGAFRLPGCGRPGAGEVDRACARRDGERARSTGVPSSSASAKRVLAVGEPRDLARHLGGRRRLQLAPCVRSTARAARARPPASRSSALARAVRGDLRLEVGHVVVGVARRAARAAQRRAQRAPRRSGRRARAGTARSTTPSSSSVRENAGIEPGVMPPMSAWWPRLATKKRSAPARRTRASTTVTSGRCEPPCGGIVGRRTRRPRAGRGSRARTARTVSPIAPRCTGMCGAFATRPPVASKTAHEKSRRSLMLVETAVCGAPRPSARRST